MLKTVFFLVALCMVLAGCQSSPAPAPQEPDQSQPSQVRPVDINDLQPRALQIVEQFLADTDPVLRSNAIEVVASTKHLDLMPAVVRLLNDRSIPVRFAALMAVGDVRYAAAQSAIEPMLKDTNGNIRVAAFYALSRLGETPNPAILRQGLNSINETVKANSVLVAGKLQDKSVIPYLRQVVQNANENDRVRFQAVESLATLGDEKVYPKIWTMLISAYADDRVIGIRAMGALNNMQARNALVTLLDNEIVEVRLAAAEQLAIMGENTGEPVVADFLSGKGISSEEKNSARAQALAALAIGQIGTDLLKSYLPGLLSADSQPVQLAAAKSVLLLASKQAQPAL